MCSHYKLHFQFSLIVVELFVIFSLTDQLHKFACVNEGADETAPLIGHYCRALANETLPTVVLPGTNAWVRMVMVTRYPMSGFQMRYKRSGALMRSLRSFSNCL